MKRGVTPAPDVLFDKIEHIKEAGFMLYMFLRKLQGKERLCSPTIGELAKITRKSKQSTRLNLHNLVEQKLIRVEAGYYRRTRVANNYYCLM